MLSKKAVDSRFTWRYTSYMTTNKVEFLYALATRLPGVTLANALGLMEDAERFLVSSVPTFSDLSTHENLVAFARTLPDVKTFLNRGQKIQAIKELRNKGREASGDAKTPDGYSVVGLLQAKNAVDALSKEPEYAGTLVSASEQPCCGKVSTWDHFSWCHGFVA